MMRSVLFDVDGTLVRLGGAGRRALIRAAEEVTGLPPDRVREVAEAIDFRGATDEWIVGRLCDGLRVSRDGAAFGSGASGRIVERYLAVLPETVRDAEKTLLPGAASIVAALEAPGARCVVGLLTGNVRAGARIKLGAFGLERLAGRPGGFGEDGASRAAVARAAVGRLAAAGVPAVRTIVIGDTEHDVTAARSAGAATVAVATGWTEPEALEESGPDLLLPDLSDPSDIFALLDSMS